MILQKILFPDVEICDEREMFFREEGNCLSLETYFNAFSIGKWMKYTNINDLHLSIKTNTKVDIEVFNAIGKSQSPETDNSFFNARKGNSLELAGVSVQRKKIKAVISSQDEFEYDIQFSELSKEGIIYVKILPIDNNTKVEILSGYYYTNGLPENDDLKIALGICTYKREAFLNKNLLLIKNRLLNNEQSLLNNKVAVFIADNGNTIDYANEKIDKELLNNACIHFYPNKNAGGASGFTRTMLEALYRSDENYSHIILMDDDIVLSTDVIERTYAFLCYLKHEYSDAMIGASMFSLDDRNIQFEAGARCRGLTTAFYHKMWDMNLADSISANEEYNPFNYSGWWYNVVPTKVIKENGLPLPLFIHYDDVEYGMRNSYKGNETILLNGICVWHPQGLGKANVSMKYYDVRNVLIAMAGTDAQVSASQIKSNLFQRVISGVLRYRYNDADAALKAVEDFYKGPEVFDKLNPEENHRNIMALNYKNISAAEAGVGDTAIAKGVEHASSKHKLIRVAQCLFCQLIPSINVTKVAEINGIGMANMARRVFHYDKDSKMGVLVQRNSRKALSLFREYKRTSYIIQKEHEEICAQWAEYKKSIVSVDKWERYLGI